MLRAVLQRRRVGTPADAAAAAAAVAAPSGWCQCRSSPGARLLSAATTGDERGTDVRKVRVYTRTGDKGTSSLYNGSRETKGHDVFHALGMTDSLNAHLGLAREQLLAQKPMAKGLQVCDELEAIQSALIDLGAAVATPPGSSDSEQLARVAFDGEGARRAAGGLDRRA